MATTSRKVLALSLGRSLRQVGCWQPPGGFFSFRRSRGSLHWAIGSWLATATSFPVVHRLARCDGYRSSGRMKFVRPSNSSSIDRLVEDLQPVEPTYSEIGGTLTGVHPVGYRIDSYEAILGSGPETFHWAVEGLRSWQAHRIRGMRVLPQGTEIRPGATVVVTLGTSVVSVAAPCRVIEVIAEPSRWGFAYGTLPGHPEQGEEAFVVSISDDDEVRFEISAFSRPGDPITRLSGPVSRGIQTAGTKGYLRALQRFVGRRS
jgi:uncharacterized protein (UPF0548 family)